MKLPEDIRQFFAKQGSIGGKKRSRAMTPGRRSAIARKAARARWDKKPTENKRGKR